MRRIPLLLFLLLSLSPAASAQQPCESKPQPSPARTEPQQSSRPTEDDVVRITTNLVQVDAVVTDKNGKLIKDLRADEVQIFEDGRQQKITNFSLVTPEASTPQPATAATLDKAAPPLPPAKL